MTGMDNLEETSSDGNPFGLPRRPRCRTIITTTTSTAPTFHQPHTVQALSKSLFASLVRATMAPALPAVMSLKGNFTPAAVESPPGTPGPPSISALRKKGAGHSGPLKKVLVANRGVSFQRFTFELRLGLLIILSPHIRLLMHFTHSSPLYSLYHIMSFVIRLDVFQFLDSLTPSPRNHHLSSTHRKSLFVSSVPHMSWQ